MPIKRAILCLTGFMKPHRLKRKGLVGLYWELNELLGPDAKVGLYAWDEYDRILKDLLTWRPKEVIPLGHSYGGSLGNFVCEALLKYPEIRVPHVVYTDPVWRPEIRTISKRSLEKDHKILLPANVEQATSFRQENGFLTGHPLKGSPSTIIHEQTICDMRHAWMDRLPAFREAAMQAVFGS